VQELHTGRANQKFFPPPRYPDRTEDRSTRGRRGAYCLG